MINPISLGIISIAIVLSVAPIDGNAVEVGSAVVPGEINSSNMLDIQASRFQQLLKSISKLPGLAVVRMKLTDQEIADIASENAQASPGTPHKVGVIRHLGLDVRFSASELETATERLTEASNGWVRRNEAGGLTWTTRIDVENTGMVRFHLTDLRLTNGAQLYLYNSAGEVRGPYEGDAQSLWTHSIPGNDLYLQIEIPFKEKTNRNNIRFTISEVVLVEPSPQGLCAYNASCIQDASCFNSSDWAAIEQARKAIAHILFAEGSSYYICTGGLVNDTVEGTYIPYVLTANHCISTQAVADTLETFFNYVTAYCGASCPTRGSRSTIEATLLNTSTSDDHTLLRLKQNPPAGSLMLGWTTDDIANSTQTIYRLSHPKGAPQAYSKHVVTPSSFTCSSLPRGAFIYSQDQLGATEGGSSGSPVLNAAGLIVGQLYGSCGYNLGNVCDSTNNRTVDGAFKNYYPSVQPWLNPSLSAPSVNTLAASGISQTGATLNASVNPNGTITTVYYDYGTSTSYGSSVTYGSVGSGTNSVSAPQPISGLSCGTTYHFRARATNSGGTTNGSDSTFTTSVCPCTEFITLQDRVESGTLTYRASSTIIAGPNYTVASTGDITFLAGQQIRLQTGFRVLAGGRFSALVDPTPCSSASLSPTSLKGIPDSMKSHECLTCIQPGEVRFNVIPQAQRLTWSAFPSGLRVKVLAHDATASDAQQDAAGENIVFATEAALLEEDGNNYSDVYQYVVSTDSLYLLSLGLDGQAGNAPSDQPRLDGIGRQLIYRSSATNLVGGAQSNFTQLYQYDLDLETTRRLTSTADGNPATGDNGQALVAGDWAIFRSEALDLAADGPGLYRQHLFHGSREPVGLDALGQQDPNASHPAANALGTAIVYQRPEEDGSMHIYLTDAVQAERLSLLSDPKLGRLEHCCAAISPDGRYFAYREQDEKGYGWLHVCKQSDCDYRRLSWPNDDALQIMAPQFNGDGSELWWIAPEQGPGLLEVLHKVENPLAAPRGTR